MSYIGRELSCDRNLLGVIERLIVLQRFEDDETYCGKKMITVAIVICGFNIMMSMRFI